MLARLQRVLNRVQSSGAGPLLPLAEGVAVTERCAPWRAPSSSRRAPPISASKRTPRSLQQRDRLVALRLSSGCARGARAARHRIPDAAHDQFCAEPWRGSRGNRSLRGSCGRCRSSAAGIGDAAFYAERLRRSRNAEHHDAESFAARRTAWRALEGGGDLAQDEDGLFLERVEVELSRWWQQLVGSGAFGSVRGGHARSAPGFMGAFDETDLAADFSLLDVQAAFGGLVLPPPAAGADLLARG